LFGKSYTDKTHSAIESSEKSGNKRDTAEAAGNLLLKPSGKVKNHRCADRRYRGVGVAEYQKSVVGCQKREDRRADPPYNGSQ
jgi:hypothetical protein